MYVLYRKEINTSFSTFVRTSRLVLYALQDLYALFYSLNMHLPFYLFMADFKTCTVGYTCQIKNRIIAQCLDLKTSIIS